LQIFEALRFLIPDIRRHFMFVCIVDGIEFFNRVVETANTSPRTKTSSKASLPGEKHPYFFYFLLVPEIIFLRFQSAANIEVT